MESLAPEELQQYFATRLPDRLAEIEEACHAAREAGWTGEPLKTFHRLVHSLAGAGATFGFPEVSDLARNLEGLLNAFLKKGTPPEGPEIRRAEGLLAWLREVPLAVSRVPAPAGGALRERSPDPGGGGKLLYLRIDDPGLREELTQQFQNLGYRVRAFQDAGELEQEADRERPAAVLLEGADLAGPTAGAEWIAAIKRAGGEAVKVLFLSPRNDLGARLEAVRAGGDAYFTQPVDRGALAEALGRLTENGPADPYRILIVEDDAELAFLYARALEEAGMRTAVVSDPMEIMAPLTGLQPDLILMDLYMPGCMGTEIAAALRQQEGYLSTPIVYLSTEEGLEEQIAAINAGGDEFLTKPITPGHLVSAVTARARRGRLIGSRISDDGLTGLLNHSHLKQRLGVELARADREGWEVAYAMVDLDRFKSINDTLGHMAGDRLLRSLAMLLRQRLRRSDLLGRYGGDEFAVILPHTDGPAALRVLEEIRGSFSRMHPFAGDREIPCTLSCGIAVYPAHASAEQLVQAADAALYDAKRLGRNRVVLKGSGGAAFKSRS